jgi:hypothetical protein
MNAMMLFLLAFAFSDAASAPSVQNVLALTAKSVQHFWEEFTAVTCKESVTQKKLGKEGKVQYEHGSSYDYLILMDLKGDDLSVEESRLLQKERGKTENLPLLLTSGFSTLQLIFHPYYQNSFEFKRLDDEVVNGRRLLRIEFRHVPGTRSTSAARLRGQDYPLDLTGTAWLDPASGVIQKIKADLVAPMDDLNLRALRAEVTYAPQGFAGENVVEWLPAEASIDVETARQHWRNTHQFTDYRRFSVKTETSVGK